MSRPETMPCLVLEPTILIAQFRVDFEGFIQVSGGYQAAAYGLQGHRPIQV
jgi:hypothetical protein